MATRLDSMGQDFRNARTHLYGMAYNVCLNSGEHEALITAMQQTERAMIRSGEDGKAIILTLMGIIIDGLSYGNWPWIKNGVSTL